MSNESEDIVSARLASILLQFFVELHQLILLNFSVPVRICSVYEFFKIMFIDSSTLLLENSVEKLTGLFTIKAAVVVGVVLFVYFGEALTEETAILVSCILLITPLHIFLRGTAAHFNCENNLILELR